MRLTMTVNDLTSYFNAPAIAAVRSPIDELEALLNSEDARPVELLADGTIRPISAGKVQS